jgi:D-alanyl-D-alanine carboxypeptidase (penicillin-binding protein 5/6)
MKQWSLGLGTLLCVVLGGSIPLLAFQQERLQLQAPIPEVAGARTVELPVLPIYAALKEPISGVAARQWAVYHVESGTVVAASPDQQMVPIASTTKLLTSSLVVSVLPLDASLTVSQWAAQAPGSRAELRKGEQYSVQELLQALLMVSGNDAARVLVEGVTQAKGLDRSEFPRLMNEHARQLGFEHFSFADAAGYESETKGTATDLTQLLAHNLENEVLKAIIGTKRTIITSADGRETAMTNTDELLGGQGVLGGKTGFTPDAGYCLVSATQRDGKTFVVAVLSSYEWSRGGASRVVDLLTKTAFEDVVIE